MQFTTSAERLRAEERTGKYTVLPVAAEILSDIRTPIEVLKILRAMGRCFLLESVEGGRQWGRYSFLGFDPALDLRVKGGVVTIRSGDVRTVETRDPAAQIRNILVQYRSPRIEGLPPFTGGFVGYFAYDYYRYLEKIELGAEGGDGSDEAHLMLFDKVIAFDHLRQKMIFICNIRADELETGYNRAAEEIKSLIRIVRSAQPAHVAPLRLLSPFTAGRTPEEYRRAVASVKVQIREGEVFQAVISDARTAHAEGDLLSAYRILRASNPSPYLYYLDTGSVQIAGSSPETLVRLTEGRLTTVPIAGTKPRGRTEAEDAASEAELLASEKELAEHNMLVDLGRNDLGKVSRFGTVRVSDYLRVHRFSRVMHLTSRVTGELNEGLDALDALAATLPAGTLSGAPKRRACQLIDLIEGERRGVYGGAVGYIDFTGNMDMCIAIRTAVKCGDRVTVRSGGGVVEGSDPAEEYRESVNKASAVIDALMRAEEADQ